MKAIIRLYKKVDGTTILKQYFRSHMLFSILFLMIQIGVDKKSLEIIRLIAEKKLNKRLSKRYKEIVRKKILPKDTPLHFERAKKKRKVWFCWLQGLDEAPPIVRRCYQSIVEHISDREIVVITDANYKDYIELPDYIEKKVAKGQISKAHFSDIIRLELLINHGGTWIDSTVLSTAKPYDYMMDSELFLFQNLKPGLDGHTVSISNWFITAEKGNRILRLTRDLLYEYWKKNNQVENYYIFHQFFQIAIEAFPEDWGKVVPFSNSTPHILLLRLFDKYDEIIWKAVKEQTPFHKLTYKFSDEELKKIDTYYEAIVNSNA